MDLNTLLEVLKTAADGESCIVDVTKGIIIIGNDYKYDGSQLSLEDAIAKAICHYPVWKANQTKAPQGCPHPKMAAYRNMFNPTQGSYQWGCSACGRDDLSLTDFS